MLDIQMESAIVGAAVTGVLALVGIGIEIWLSQRTQRRYFIDTHVVTKMEECESKVSEILDLGLKLAGRQGTEFERTAMASRITSLATDVVEELIMTYSLKNNDFQKELKQINSYTKFLLKPVTEATPELINESKKRLMEFTLTIGNLKAVIGGVRMFKIDELSGHKNRNRITKWKKVKKWFKRCFDHNDDENDEKKEQ